MLLIVRVLCILMLIGACSGIVLYRKEVTHWVAAQLDLLENEEVIPVRALERGPLEVDVSAEGEIVGLETVPVSTPRTQSGSLKLAWLATEGTMAAPGDVLIRYDSTDARLNLETQNNTLSENVIQSKIDSGNQEVSDKSMAGDQNSARLDYEYALETKPEDPAIFSQWEIINAQLNADFAKSKIENLAQKAKTQKRLSRSAQQISTIARNRAQAEVDILEQALAAMAVKAPAGGLVVYRRDRRQDPKIGDNCQPGQVMIDLVNMDALQARIYVLEKEAGGLAKGQPVAVHLDALPDKELHGEIQTVSSVATTIEREGVLKYFTCNVTINDARPYLRFIKPGMTLQARIVLVKYDSCFMVPASTLDWREKEEKTYVYIKTAEGFEKREVMLGVGKHGQATILEGVKDKELIALRNPFETKKLVLPDFSKTSATSQTRRGGPGGPMMGGGDMMPMMEPPPGMGRGR